MRERRAIAVVVMSVVSSCGGGSPGTPPAPVLQVAGSYEVAKTLVEDGCGGIPARVSNAATVQHVAGAGTFVLTDHGSRQLQGMVRRDGTFALAPAPAVVHGSIPALDTFADGRFTAAGYRVVNTTALEATADSGACRIVVLWEGAKQGAPNVLP